MLVYRFHRAVRAAGDYTGSFLAGGRWNPPGTAMLYTAQNVSLACLEILVHLDKRQFPPEYVWSSARLPGDPAVFKTENFLVSAARQTAGQAWAETANELAVRVRSVVVSEEFNVLLNPKHRRYGEVVWSNPHPFSFDPRLFAFGTDPE